jgi:hypothetical protein
MADIEKVFRKVLRLMLESPGLMENFISKDRDRFLEEFVFSHVGSVESPVGTDPSGNRRDDHFGFR